MLEEKINNLKAELVTFGRLVENMISKGVTGIISKDKKMLKEIIKVDEPKANQFDLDLDDICTKLIAQFQPKAKHLRTILMAYKIVNDLERMGDLGVNIAESGLYLVEHPQIDELNDLIKLAQEKAGKMLSESIRSFIDQDTSVVQTICANDEEVDQLRNKVLEKASEIMKGNPDSVDKCMHYVRIARNIERTADLSTNICEDVMYMVEGKVIMHPKITKQGRKDL